MRRTAPTVLLAGGLLAVACSGQSGAPDDAAAGAVVVSDEPGALEAMADTLSGSFRWTGDLELTIDRGEVDAALAQVAEATGEPLPPEADQWMAELDEYAETADESSAHGALADDGSWQVAFAHLGDTWLDLRFGLGEILDAQTLTPEATILARIGWETLFATFEEAADWDVRDEMRRTADEGPDAGTPFAEVLHALADGDWGGLAGTIDLAELGVADGDLDAHAQEFRREFAGVADRATMLALADEALTVRDYTPVEGGLTRATVDLHPRDAAFAMYDLFDDAAALADADAESLPETVEGAVTITFDGQGRLVEVRTDVLVLAAHALDAQAELHEAQADPSYEPTEYEWVPDDPAAEAAELRAGAAAIRGLERTTAAVVFAMSDHGEIPTVVDEDAVTMPWGDLADVFFGGLYE